MEKKTLKNRIKTLRLSTKQLRIRSAVPTLYSVHASTWYYTRFRAQRKLWTYNRLLFMFIFYSIQYKNTYLYLWIIKFNLFTGGRLLDLAFFIHSLKIWFMMNFFSLKHAQVEPVPQFWTIKLYLVFHVKLNMPSYVSFYIRNLPRKTSHSVSEYRALTKNSWSRCVLPVVIPGIWTMYNVQYTLYIICLIQA